MVVPKEKHAFAVGIRDYEQTAGGRVSYKSLTNPAQNAFQMARFFRKHGYDTVQSTVKEQEDVAQKRARATFREDLAPVLDDFLLRAQQAKKQPKRKMHFFIYYSGVVVQTADTEEFCGVDSAGELIPLERYCEALASFKNVFTVCYVEGVFIREPKRLASDFISRHEDSLIMSLCPHFSKRQATSNTGGQPQPAGKAATTDSKKKGMSIFYQTLEYPEIASNIPYFLLSRMTHRLISFVNSAGIAGLENPDDRQRYQNADGSFKRPAIELIELHVIFRENYFNHGAADKDWKVWKIFNDPIIEKLKFEESNRKYIGEISLLPSTKS